MRDIIMGITPYPSKERVENKMCTGTEYQETNHSINNEENKQVYTAGTKSNNKMNVEQVQDVKPYDKDGTKEVSTQD